MITVTSLFSKQGPFSKRFLSTRKLKAGVSEKLCFREITVWTVGLTAEIKLRFLIPRRSVDRA